MSEKAAKPLSIQDWEHVLQDFGKDPEAAQRKWVAGNHGLLDQALQYICKKELTLKLQLCVFLEENARLLIGSAVQSALTSIVDTARNLLHAALDANVVTSAVKEQIMVTATVIAIDMYALHNASRALETLVELLLGFISRTNYAPERHVRAVACECLRELEMAHPCLLNVCLGHVFNLCQADRTHSGQSYVLLLSTIVHNQCKHLYRMSTRLSTGQQTIVSTAVPLVPFSIPFFLVKTSPLEEAHAIPSRELTSAGLKEFRRVVAYLLERTDLLTDFGLLEMVAKLISIAKALDVHGSLLKHQFASLSHTYSPILCHAYLMMATNFVEAFAVDEDLIFRQLIFLCRDSTQPVPFRILSVHWLVGIEMLRSPSRQRHGLISLTPKLHPLVFEPLSLKAAKLNALAYCAGSIQKSSSITREGQSVVDVLEMPHQLLSKGLLSVSAFKWLPPGSTETRLAFQLLNRFLTQSIPHSTGDDVPDISVFAESTLFQTVEEVLLSLAVDTSGLVRSLLSFIDRLLSCKSHQRLGDLLLHTCSDKLLPKLAYDVLLPAYFPLLERMGEKSGINPRPIVRAMTSYIAERVRASKGKGSLVMWIRGSQVLGICRILMAHHYSSRIYGVLTELLGIMTLHYPDLELRDSARMYLRMVLTIPGRKLRSMLNPKEERVEESAYSLARFSTFLKSPPPMVEVKKRKLRVAAYVLLSRETPLTVPHAWSMVLYKEIESTFKGDKTVTEHKVTELEDDVTLLLEPSGFEARQEVPRVTDAATSHILNILRRHFANILDFCKGTGFKIQVPCQLKFQGEVKLRLLSEGDLKCQGQFSSYSHSVWESTETWPALYAVVVCFSTTGPYGPIRKLRVPVLPSIPPSRSCNGRSAASGGGDNTLLTGVSDGSEQDTVLESKSEGALLVRNDSLQALEYTQAGDEAVVLEASRALHRFTVELEPKQPVPTWVEAKIAFSDERGQAVGGQLDSIPIGFEDLFLVAPCPQDVGTSDEAQYRLDLFKALWDGCGGPGKLGGETFFLKGGRTGVDVKGTESVKLLEAPAARLVDAVGYWLLPYVVAVSGDPIVADAGSWEGFRGLFWEEQESRSVRPGRPLSLLRLKADDSSSSSQSELSKQLVVAETSEDHINFHKGCLHVLIFLPPRYHLLFKMEVSAYSTLVRIRTDHWPCLAYVDEYLEALIMMR